LLDIALDESVPTQLRILAAKEALPFCAVRHAQIAITDAGGESLNARRDQDDETITLAMQDPVLRATIEQTEILLAEKRTAAARPRLTAPNPERTPS
jgi:hypothetical protein